MFLLSVQTTAGGVLGGTVLLALDCPPYKYIGAINSLERFSIKRTFILYSHTDAWKMVEQPRGRWNEKLMTIIL